MSYQPTEDTVFTLLSNGRRRQVIRAFQQLDPPLSVGTLAEHIAASENDKPVEAVTSEERRRVYTSLQQRHLDKLEEAGVITCERGEIEPTDQIEELEVQLNVVEADNIGWPEYYLGLSVIAAGVLLLASTGVYPEIVPSIVWAFGVVTVFGISAAVQLYQRTTNTVAVTEQFTRKS